MRKASREMPTEWALEVMRKAPYITVSFTREDGTAYGLPLSLASAGEDGRVWYFHCAQEGEKLVAIAAHPEVCLSAVSKCSPTVGPKDGSFTLQYGRIRRVGPPQPAPHCRSPYYPYRTAYRQAQAVRQGRGGDEVRADGMTLHTGKLQQFLVGHALAGLIPDAAAVGEAEAGEDALHVEVVVVGVDFEAADAAGDG